MVIGCQQVELSSPLRGASRDTGVWHLTMHVPNDRSTAIPYLPPSIANKVIAAGQCLDQ